MLLEPPQPPCPAPPEPAPSPADAPAPGPSSLSYPCPSAEIAAPSATVTFVAEMLVWPDNASVAELVTTRLCNTTVSLYQTVSVTMVTYERRPFWSRAL
ncbi:MAG TPA: hypothetical protein ENN99_04400 [Chloroflexi bacterium]|nr:hypothetical protein [Chloroflexota bacterium]